MTFECNWETQHLLEDRKFAEEQIAKMNKKLPKFLLKLKDEVEFCKNAKAEYKAILNQTKDYWIIKAAKDKRIKAKKDVTKAQQEYSACLDMKKTFEAIEKRIADYLRPGYLLE